MEAMAINGAARVYLVEDDAAVSDSLNQLLQLKGYLTTSFDSAESFLSAARPDWRGCAILDIRLPGMNGLELQAELRARGIGLRVIIITGHGDTSNSRAAFKAGAIDFLEKPINTDALLEAVAASFSSAQDEFQHDEAGYADLSQKLERLTERENQVLELILQGKHSREVAELLEISPRTVEVYKSRMMEKLQVSRTNDLLRLVISHRLSGSGKISRS